MIKPMIRTSKKHELTAKNSRDTHLLNETGFNLFNDIIYNNFFPITACPMSIETLTCSFPVYYRYTTDITPRHDPVNRKDRDREKIPRRTKMDQCAADS
ncbi:hypothetical protein Pfo_007355 [Paulownia fortunei]|nr:hypothetical protein Pfo_007355 [Paulownia fortunei]